METANRNKSQMHFNGKTEWVGTSHKVLPNLDALDEDEARLPTAPKVTVIDTTAVDSPGSTTYCGMIANWCQGR